MRPRAFIAFRFAAASCAPRALCGLLALSACALISGCALMEGMSDATKQTMRSFKPRPDDWDPGSEKDAEWNWVGDESRHHYGRERDPDRWWKRYMMSEKANSIERNFGID